ncbi:MAG: DUF4232 domain-containing protein [Candidatus Dormiibacterota bacterium]
MKPRTTVAAPAVLLAAVLAGCAGTGASPGSGRAAGQPVPWAAIAPEAAPALTPLAVPSGTSKCRTSQLEGRFVANAGLTGGQIASGFAFADSSATSCQLDGTPTVKLLASSGTEVSIQVSPDLVDPVPSAPVLLLPGLTVIKRRAIRPGQASLVLYWPTLDLATGGTDCSPPATGASSVTFSIAGDAGQVSVKVPTSGVPGAPIAPCDGALEVSPFQAVIPSPPTNLPRLTARIEAPAQVSAGNVLRYRVVLTDKSKVAVDFARGCASYGEVLAGEPASGTALKVVQQYQLNCALAGTLRPGHSTSFAMELRIPLGAPHLTADLTWGILNSTAFTTAAESVGARVHIT